MKEKKRNNFEKYFILKNSEAFFIKKTEILKIFQKNFNFIYINLFLCLTFKNFDFNFSLNKKTIFIFLNQYM